MPETIPHMKLILVHSPPSNPTSDLGQFLTSELSHIFNCPKVIYVPFNTIFQNIVGFLSGSDVSEYTPKRLFPYGDLSNKEAEEAIRTFFYNWFGRDFSAKVFVEHCHASWKHSDPGHRPVFVTDAVVGPGHWEILKQSFKIVEVFSDEAHMEAHEAVHKSLVREGNRRDFLNFVRESAAWMVQND